MGKSVVSFFDLWDKLLQSVDVSKS